MTNGTHSLRLALGACSLLVSLQALAAPAEYAIRWDPSRGGPGSALDAAAALRLQVDKAKVYRIDYFDVASGADVLPVIARRRTHGDTTQLTLKTRSADGQGAAPAQSVCALGSGAEAKTEVDVTMLAGGQVKRVPSWSCTLQGPRGLAFPPQLRAVPRGCIATMRRLRAGDVDIEEWSVHGGAQRLVEVSMKGEDDDATQRRFADRVAAPLLAAHAAPLSASKTEFVAGCTP